MTQSTPTAPAFKSRVFLCGADMNPQRIRQRWPNARFVAIARANGILTRGAGLPPNAFGPDLWGIVVETGAEQRGMPVPLTLRDGSEATAMITGTADDLGTLDELLAEARYWELPAAYRDQVAAVIAGQR